MSLLTSLTRPFRVFRGALAWMRVRECVRRERYADALGHLDRMDALAGRIVSQSAVMRALLLSQDRNRHLVEIMPAILRASEAVSSDKTLRDEDRRYLEGCLWVLGRPMEETLSEAERRLLKRDLRAIRLDQVSLYVRDNFTLLERPHWS